MPPPQTEGQGSASGCIPPWTPHAELAARSRCPFWREGAGALCGGVSVRLYAEGCCVCVSRDAGKMCSCAW